MRPYGIFNYKGKIGPSRYTSFKKGWRARICSCCISSNVYQKVRAFKKKARQEGKIVYIDFGTLA